MNQPAAPAAEAAATPCRLSARWTGDADAYCQLRGSAEQLGTSFRFRTGSAELDTRATQDLRRVLDRMEHTPDKTIVLAGFADSSGAYASNCALSRSRAGSVASALEPDSKAYLRASRLRPNWMVARVTKERTEAARFS